MREEYVITFINACGCLFDEALLREAILWHEPCRILPIYKITGTDEGK
jgi:hypothetical protein